MALVWAVKGAVDAYTFEHTGHVSGSLESGSSNDNWQEDGQRDVIAQNWAAIVANDSGPAQANATGDLTSLINSIIGAVGTGLGIVAIVAA
jgi:hypothetical protein